jgi:hypothetical protein
MLVSIPARAVRFFLAPVATAGVQRLVAPLTRRRAAVEAGLLAVLWIGFYAFYFAELGW